MPVIKVCGITNEEDARFAIEAGANALGFNFYAKSPRYVTVQRAREIIEAVPGDYLKVGVFVNPAADELNAESMDVVQLHGESCPVVTGRTVWKAIAPNEFEMTYRADAYLFDAPTELFGGSGKTFDWSLVTKRDFRFLIAGGLDSSNVAQAIALAQPWGVDSCSRLESSPGKKDPRKVEAYVAAAQKAFAAL